MKPRAAALVGCATMAVHTSGPALVPRRYSEASRTGTSPAGFPRFSTRTTVLLLSRINGPFMLARCTTDPLATARGQAA